MEYLRFLPLARGPGSMVSSQHRESNRDNQKKPDVTVLRVRTDDSGGQSLLSLASTITGLGLRMNMAKLDLQNELGGATTATWRRYIDRLRDEEEAVKQPGARADLHACAGFQQEQGRRVRCGLSRRKDDERGRLCQ